jgi:periplasmic divalent cation tolerance protein
MGLSQLLTTLSTREQAVALARGVVGERMASCVQIIGPITSVYRWQGDLEETAEFLCLMKAPSERMSDLVAFVTERHPYDTPEITTVDSASVDERYLAWAKAETRSP